MLKKILFSASLMLILGACHVADTPTRYYQLPDSAFRLPEEKRGAEMAVNIRLAEPLKNRGLLYQDDAYTLHFAQKNVWAAPLEEAMGAAMSNKLNRVGALKYVPATHQKMGLTVYFDRFQGSYTGKTEISGYAQWHDGAQKSFHVITAQQGDGYAAMMDSLNAGLDEVAKIIAR